MIEEIKNIIDKERILPNKKYKTPFLILLTGNIGSGKSLVSKLLSKDLSLYIISGDYIRNVIIRNHPQVNLHSDTARKTNNSICIDEINYCIANNYAIVLDRSISNKKDLLALKEKVNIPIILIKLNSTEEENIKRVIKRKTEKDKNIIHYGHPESKSGVVTKEEYYLVKARKVYDLEDNIYDYIINTNTSLDNLYLQIKKIVSEIQSKYN